MALKRCRTDLSLGSQSSRTSCVIVKLRMAARDTCKALILRVLLAMIGMRRKLFNRPILDDVPSNVISSRCLLSNSSLASRNIWREDKRIWYRSFPRTHLNIWRRSSGLSLKNSKKSEESEDLDKLEESVGVNVVFAMAVECSRVWRFGMDRSRANAVATRE